jgi:hypothetical protein
MIAVVSIDLPLLVVATWERWHADSSAERSPPDLQILQIFSESV